MSHFEELIREENIEPGDHERFSHYVKKDKIVESAVMGTPAYMAPEAILGITETFEQYAMADQYSLAVTAYFALTGTLPFDGGSPPLSRVNPQVSTGLSDVVARCVEAADRLPRVVKHELLVAANLEHRHRLGRLARDLGHRRRDDTGSDGIDAHAEGALSGRLADRGPGHDADRPRVPEAA